MVKKSLKEKKDSRCLASKLCCSRLVKVGYEWSCTSHKPCCSCRMTEDDTRVDLGTGCSPWGNSQGSPIQTCRVARRETCKSGSRRDPGSRASRNMNTLRKSTRNFFGSGSLCFVCMTIIQIFGPSYGTRERRSHHIHCSRVGSLLRCSPLDKARRAGLG
jgi:hypothetical protein